MAQDGDDTEVPAASPQIVQGISDTRLHLIIIGFVRSEHGKLRPRTHTSRLWLCLFISAMDTTIVTTALIKISSDFHALEQGAWLITAYLLTYNSFLMITAKLSDVMGLKSTLLACNIFFLVFSMACGGAKSMNQLYETLAFSIKVQTLTFSVLFSGLFKVLGARVSIHWSLWQL
jgi:MFS family permease